MVGHFGVLMSRDSWQFLTDISGGFGGIVKLQAFLGVRCIGINVKYGSNSSGRTNFFTFLTPPHYTRCLSRNRTASKKRQSFSCTPQLQPFFII